MVLCNICKQEKEQDDFYPYSLTKCKACYSMYQREYHKNNKQKRKEYAQEHYKKTKEKHLKKNKEYYKNNKKKHQELCRLRDIERKKIDIDFKLRKALRKRLCTAIYNNQKSGSAVNDLGCTVQELKSYLEGLFKPGMSWDNWTIHGWHIDHIRPLSSFDLSNPEQFKQACHYTNLQPLWAEENFKKRDIYERK